MSAVVFMHAIPEYINGQLDKKFRFSPRFHDRPNTHFGHQAALLCMQIYGED